MWVASRRITRLAKTQRKALCGGCKLKKIDKNQYTAYGNKGTKTSIVTFLDILGYRNYVKDADGPLNDKLALLKQTVEKGYKYVRDDIFPKQSDSQRFWETKTFSDNISIFYPLRNGQIFAPGHDTCSDNIVLALFHVTSLLASLQMEMIRSGGFFVRGSIAVGEAYVDDNFIFSDGLIEAYESENKDAIDPRIIFSKSAAESIDKYIENGSNGDRFDYLYGITKDADGLYYVDYLKHLEDESEFSKDNFLDIHKEYLTKKINDFKNDPKCLRKYLWSVNYHNRFCGSVGMTDKILQV